MNRPAPVLVLTCCAISSAQDRAFADGTTVTAGWDAKPAVIKPELPAQVR